MSVSMEYNPASRRSDDIGEFPDIIVTSHDELNTPGRPRIDLEPLFYDGHRHDGTSPGRGDAARKVLEDWEERYKANPISQVDFFRPEELDSTCGASSRDEDDKLELDVGDELLTDHTVPQIVVHQPDESDASAGFTEKPSLKKALPLGQEARFAPVNNLENTLRPAIRLRRHSFSNVSVQDLTREPNLNAFAKPKVQPTPQPWSRIDAGPKGGWKMRSRCSPWPESGHLVDIVVVYLYNSGLCDTSTDADIDLDAFRHQAKPHVGSLSNAPTQPIRRARTDIGKMHHQVLPTIFTNTQNRITFENVKPRPVSWIQDENMLQKRLPGSRVITVGFDLSSMLSTVPDFEAAAQQLHERLCQLREQRQAPIVFLGHSFGCLIILHALASLSSGHALASNVFPHTAGVFLFSSPLSNPETCARSFTKIHGVKPSGKVLNDLLGSTSMSQMREKARTSLVSSRQGQQDGSRASPRGNQGPSSLKNIAIGFPITQIHARGDDQGTGQGSISELLGIPTRTLMFSRDAAHVLKFAASDDVDFMRLTMLMKANVQLFGLLRASIDNNPREVDALLKEGVNPNLRDRLHQTPLQIAVRLNHEKLVHSLLNVDGLNVNVRDSQLNTPLHHAVRNGKETIITALLHHGADIAVENTHKRTPKALAERHKSRRHIAKMLRSRVVKGPDHRPSAQRIGNGRSPTSEEGKLACKNYQVTVTEVYVSKSSDKHWSVNISVEALLYGSTSLKDILGQVRPKELAAKLPVCTWVHVPENNMVWVEDLFSKLGLHPAIWQETRRSVTGSLSNRAITPHIGTSDHHSIFIPFLSYEANMRHERRTEYVHEVDQEHSLQNTTDANIPGSVTMEALRNMSHKLSSKEPELLQVPVRHSLPLKSSSDDYDSGFSDNYDADDPDDLEEEEKALVTAYLHDPPALHIRRTLDQYYYHMLDNTKERDMDQVVSRWAEQTKAEARHNILMVDQLWLWSTHQKASPSKAQDKASEIRTNREQMGMNNGSYLEEEPQDHYVISCFPSRTGTGQHAHRVMDDLRLLVLDPTHRKRHPIRKPEDRTSRILETCCSVFDRLLDAEPLRFFQMFEESVGTIDDNESRLFRAFQRGSTHLMQLKATNKYYEEKKNKLLVDLLDIREEVKLLVEIKDILDEINIILSVLDIQRTVIKQRRKAEGFTFLGSSAAEVLIKADIDDFKKLEGHSRTIQEKINTLMDLKQKAANAWEAREARETTVAASKQGNTILVFTIVTIVFLPLSFMSSFFAIGIAAFPKDNITGETNWPLGIVTGLLFGISLSVSIPLIVLALNMEHCAATYRELRDNYFARIGMYLIALAVPLIPERWANILVEEWNAKLRRRYEAYTEDGSRDIMSSSTLMVHKEREETSIN